MLTHQYLEAKNPSRVVVIGGNGFIGKVFCAHLKALEVPYISPKSSEIDLSDSACVALSRMVEPSDVVVMLAAITPDRGRNSEVLIKNLVMMRNLLKALEKSNCSHLIHISSDAVYNNEINFIKNEEATGPQDLYGVMHLARELMLKDFTNLPILILRPTLVYGYGDTHNAYGINRFIRTAKDEGKISIFGCGEEMRDHIYVECVADFIMRCIRFKTTGISFLASGVSTSFHDLAIFITQNFKRKIDLVPVARKNPITHRQYDNSHLLEAFPDLNFIMPEKGIIKVLTEMNLAVNRIGDTNFKN